MIKATSCQHSHRFIYKCHIGLQDPFVVNVVFKETSLLGKMSNGGWLGVSMSLGLPENTGHYEDHEKDEAT